MWIGNGLHGFGKLVGLYRRCTMLLPPDLEEFRDALTTGVVGLE